MPTPPTPSPPPVPPPATNVYSAIKAVMNLYTTLNAANYPNGTQPPIFLTEAAVTQPGTANPVIQQRVPFVILEDLGEQPTEASGRGNPWAQMNSMAIFDGQFNLKFYYNSLGDADTANFATLWNGQDPSQHEGLAFCQLAISPPYYSLPFNCIPMKCIRFYAGLDNKNNRVHCTSQTYIRRIYQDPKTLYS